MGPLRRGARSCPAPTRPPISHPLSFLKSCFLPGCGARRADCKVGLCMCRGLVGLCEVRAPLGSGEEIGGGRGAQGPPQEGTCLLRWWEWDWTDAPHSACAFPGVSFLFFPEEKGLRRGHARARCWVATLGNATRSWVPGKAGRANSRPPCR